MVIFPEKGSHALRLIQFIRKCQISHRYVIWQKNAAVILQFLGEMKRLKMAERSKKSSEIFGLLDRRFFS